MLAVRSLVLPLILVGCSSSREVSDECPVAECPMALCTCATGGGAVLLDRCRNGFPCQSARSICKSDLICSDGLDAIGKAVPDLSVAGSPECKAYCAKIVSQPVCYQGCNERERCWNEESKCAASTRVYLQCLADKGTFICLGPPSSEACVVDNSVCSPDAATGG